ncbi:hypothetical protein HK099_001439 [Clydaea vesicula]|uniref:J domain-containing protein n=1 Tax=Clydaea vesicula TaxID=447962 RepID=A0AAD5U3G6_9FUNG|nr:hypothetical protein HK099_001439 [Clydaea vesicula]
MIKGDDGHKNSTKSTLEMNLVGRQNLSFPSLRRKSSFDKVASLVSKTKRLSMQLANLKEIEDEFFLNGKSKRNFGSQVEKEEVLDYSEFNNILEIMKNDLDTAVKMIKRHQMANLCHQSKLLYEVLLSEINSLKKEQQQDLKNIRKECQEMLDEAILGFGEKLIEDNEFKALELKERLSEQEVEIDDRFESQLKILTRNSEELERYRFTAARYYILLKKHGILEDQKEWTENGEKLRTANLIEVFQLKINDLDKQLGDLRGSMGVIEEKFEKQVNLSPVLAQQLNMLNSNIVDLGNGKSNSPGLSNNAVDTSILISIIKRALENQQKSSKPGSRTGSRPGSSTYSRPPSSLNKSLKAAKTQKKSISFDANFKFSSNVQASSASLSRFSINSDTESTASLNKKYTNTKSNSRRNTSTQLNDIQISVSEESDYKIPVSSKSRVSFDHSSETKSANTKLAKFKLTVENIINNKKKPESGTKICSLKTPENNAAPKFTKPYEFLSANNLNLAENRLNGKGKNLEFNMIRLNSDTLDPKDSTYLLDSFSGQSSRKGSAVPSSRYGFPNSSFSGRGSFYPQINNSNRSINENVSVSFLSPNSNSMFQEVRRKSKAIHESADHSERNQTRLMIKKYADDISRAKLKGEKELNDLLEEKKILKALWKLKIHTLKKNNSKTNIKQLIKKQANLIKLAVKLTSSVTVEKETQCELGGLCYRDTLPKPKAPIKLKEPIYEAAKTEEEIAVANSLLGGRNTNSLAFMLQGFSISSASPSLNGLDSTSSSHSSMSSFSVTVSREPSIFNLNTKDRRSLPTRPPLHQKAKPSNIFGDKQFSSSTINLSALDQALNEILKEPKSPSIRSRSKTEQPKTLSAMPLQNSSSSRSTGNLFRSSSAMNLTEGIKKSKKKSSTPAVAFNLESSELSDSKKSQLGLDNIIIKKNGDIEEFIFSVPTIPPPTSPNATSLNSPNMLVEDASDASDAVTKNFLKAPLQKNHFDNTKVSYEELCFFVPSFSSSGQNDASVTSASANPCNQSSFSKNESLLESFKVVDIESQEKIENSLEKNSSSISASSVNNSYMDTEGVFSVSENCTVSVPQIKTGRNVLINFEVMVSNYDEQTTNVVADNSGFFEENLFEDYVNSRVHESTPLLRRASVILIIEEETFVGTGVLFLPKAFYNGGILFSIIILFVTGFLALHCMNLIVDISRELGGMSYGDIGGKIYGRRMRSIVLFSIALAQSVSCWKCGQSVASKPKNGHATFEPFCVKEDCNVIQPVNKNLNYFELLNANDKTGFVNFDLNLIKLKKNFLFCQKLLHPDVFSQRSEDEKKLSEEQSSVYNKAYQVLKNPLYRAEYLLQLKNININESELQNNVTFLNKIMEIREEVEDCKSVSELESLQKENDERYELTVKRLAKEFKDLNFEQAKHSTMELKYWAMIRNAINEKFNEF